MAGVQIANGMIDTAMLIKSVEMHPVLWNTNHSDFSNQALRLKAWHAVAIRCLGGDSWKRLRDIDKRLNVNMLQKRWKNLKDTYTKYSRRKDGPYHKTYIHAENLKFLAGIKRRYRRMIIADPEEGSSRHTNETEENEDSPDEDTVGNFIKEEENVTFEKEFIQNYIVKNVPGNLNKSEFVDILGAPTEDTSTNDVDDPDKMFLLSMLPLFKKLDEEKKMTARIELTLVLQKLLFPEKN